MFAGVFERGEPHAFHVLAGEPFVVLAAETDHRAALVADEIVRGDADRPAEARRLRNDLIERMH